MRIKLLQLTLHDFKGIRDFVLDTQGRNATILGANGTGKTTLANAFLWLLTGKDIQGRENYEIFPLNEDGTRVSGCMPMVTASIEVDGVVVTITRQLTEKYTKRAGSTTAVYAGDETKCTIDDVPTAITKYNAWVDGTICPAELLPLLINAAYFSEQTKDYRQRRELLLKQFGGVDEQQIIADTPQLAPLREAIGRHSVEEMRQILTTQRKVHADTLKAIPARIDELRRQIDENLPDPEELRHKRGQLEVEIAKLKHAQSGLSAEQVAGEARKEKDQLQQTMQLLQAQRKLLEKTAEQGVAAKLAELRAHEAENEMLASNLHRVLNTAIHNVDALDSKINQLRKVWIQRNAEQPVIKDICPCCGQPLPEDQVQAALNAWNLEKSSDLERISMEANELKAKAEKLREEISQTSHKAEAADAAVQKIRLACEQAQTVESASPKISQDLKNIDQKMQALQATAAEIDKRIENAEQTAYQSGAELRNKISVLQEASDTIGRDMARIELGQLTISRISELENEQKHTLGELEKAEMLLSLCGEYTKIMVERLTEQVNQHFKTVEFKLFETQKNGGLKEVCEATGNGVPYGSLNTAARMQANVEIVEAFAWASSRYLPLFLDNRESVTKVDASPDIQIINLQVAEGEPLTCTTI